MKLAEAILEKKILGERAKLLESRIMDDLSQGRLTTRLQEELQRALNQERDMTISIEWTEQNTLLAGIPIGGYRIRIKYLLKLASILEDLNRTQADEFWFSAQKDIKVVEAATWLVDLKIPGDENKEDS